MPAPGFFAQAAVYKSSIRYRTVASGISASSQFRIAIPRAAQNQPCDGATISQCLTDAENVLNNESDACNDLPTQLQRSRCRAAAIQEYRAAIAKCNPCPAGTRCDANVCCPNEQPTCAPPCSFASSGTTSTNQISITSGTLLFQSTNTIDRKTKTSTNQIVVRQGTNPLITMQTSPLPSGGITTTVDYGPMFTGAQHAVFSTNDGVNFVGVIDGRPTVPYTKDTEPSTITFQDGSPLPALGSSTPGLIDQLNTLAQTVQSSSATVCNAVPSPAVQPSRFDSGQFVVPAYHIKFPGPGQSACNTCDNTCLRDEAICSAGAASLLVACFFPPACAAAVAAAAALTAGCDATYLGCVGLCSLDDCCPKRCGAINPFDQGSGCCESDETCVDENDPNAERGGCCPAGRNVCNGNCCRDGENCLQGVCCPPGTKSACNGVCCNGDCDKNGNCCSPPSTLCKDGTCCAPFGESCHPTLGTCCSLICGPSCCADGQFCQDPVNGICGGCPDGQKVCNGPLGTPKCCPNGTDCCANGQCCPAGTCCCGTQSGWECRPLSDVCCTPR